MAINPLPEIFKSLTFDGETSASYGVQILGEGVFNAPERAVEMINIPGRNGAIVLDQGYYENTEVSYPATIIADNPEDFAAGMAAFRNFLCSKIGYCRLTDDYNPDEYRMAVYKSGLEVDEKVLRVGEFDIVFDCKPQRWLTDGEQEVVVEDGDEIVNPTLFDSEPLFSVEGHGSFQVDDYNIDLHDPYRGDTMIMSPKLYTYVDGAYPGDSGGMPVEYSHPEDVANDGDDITVKPVTFYWALYLLPQNYEDERIGTVTVTDSGDLGGTTTIMSRYNRTLHLRTVVNAKTYDTWSRTQEDITHTVTLNVAYTANGSHTATLVYNLALSTRYYTADGYRVRYEDTPGSSSYYPLDMYMERLSTKGTSVDSSVWVLGTPTYLDCEIGECYMIDDGKIVSLNDHIDLGSGLPKLKPGSNSITADNTITEIKVAPRWWQL